MGKLKGSSRQGCPARLGLPDRVIHGLSLRSLVGVLGILLLSFAQSGCISSRPLASYLSAEVDDRVLWPRGVRDLRYREHDQALQRVGDFWLHPRFTASEESYLNLSLVRNKDMSGAAPSDASRSFDYSDQTLLLEGRGSKWLGMGLKIADERTFSDVEMRDETQSTSAVDLSGEIREAGASPGFDVRRFDAIRFDIKYESTMPVKAKIGLHLASYHPDRRRSPEIDLARANPLIDFGDGGWHSVSVPLEKLLRPSMDSNVTQANEGLVDPTKVSELSLGIWSDTVHEFRIYVRRFVLEQEQVE